MNGLPDTVAPYRKMLRLVGTMFILYGFFDIGMLIYCIRNELDYSSSYNFVAVIAGILIRRGSLRVARYAAWFNAFFASGALVVLPLIALVVPVGLISAVFRQEPISAVVVCLYTSVSLLFITWTQWRLSTKPVKEAYPRRPPRPFWKSIPGVIGAIAGIGLVAVTVSMLNSPAAHHAITKARVETGPGYSYFVTLVVRFDDSDYIARVVAYNDRELRRIEVVGVIDDGAG